MPELEIQVPPAQRKAVGDCARGLMECHVASVDGANRMPVFDGELKSAVNELSAFVRIREQATHAAACREDVPAAIEGDRGHLAELLREVVRQAADNLTHAAEGEAGAKNADDLIALSECAAWASRELIELSDCEPLAAVA